MRDLADELLQAKVKARLFGGDHAPRSVAQGADTAVWLATLPDDGPTGGFFRDRKAIAW